MKDCYHNEEYSMVLRMIISEKWIHISSYDLVLSISLDTFYSNKNYEARKIRS